MSGSTDGGSGVRINPSVFDSEELYTTQWFAPHHDRLTFGRAGVPLERSPGGRILRAEMSDRGLDVVDLGLEASATELRVSLPPTLGRASIVIPTEQPARADVDALTMVLDIACANIAREIMMRSVGWTPADPEPAWAQLTTPLTELVLRASGFSSHTLWSLPKTCFDHFGRTESTPYEKGDARDGLPPGYRATRLGPILKLEGPLQGGCRFTQGDCTSVIVPKREATVTDELLSGGTVRSFGSLGAGQLARFLERRRVRAARSTPELGSTMRMLEIEMPMITMEPIPSKALKAIGMGVPVEQRRYPYWCLVQRLGHASGRADLPRLQ